MKSTLTAILFAASTVPALAQMTPGPIALNAAQVRAIGGKPQPAQMIETVPPPQDPPPA